MTGDAKLKKIRFMIVDDQQIIREGLAGMLSREVDLELVGIAKNGLEAVTLAPSLKPDLILMDLRMPLMDGAQAIREIRKNNPEIRFIILTVYDNDDELFEALRAGAKAFLLKDVSHEELISVIHTVAEGKAHLQPELTSMLLDHLMEMPTSETPAIRMTERELSVLKLLARGASNKEIGNQLAISEHTVKTHVANIFSKLESRDRTEAVAKAIQKGLIQI
jgi:DNA-binding NarL/FixJ family response regulator